MGQLVDLMSNYRLLAFEARFPAETDTFSSACHTELNVPSVAFLKLAVQPGAGRWTTVMTEYCAFSGTNSNVYNHK